MAIYLDIINLIIKKEAITNKYDGGLDQFRIDYDIPLSEINMEDDELFCLSQMNVDAFDIDILVEKGLSFDAEEKNQMILQFFLDMKLMFYGK